MKPFLLKNWTFKDYTTVGVTGALCIIVGILVKMVLGLVISKVPALSSLILAMAQAILITISLMRLPKAGFLSVLGFCMGVIYGFIFPAHPFMFATFVIAGLVGDGVAWLAGGYKSGKAIAASVVSFRLSVIVAGAVIAWWIGFAKTDLAWTLILINCAGSAAGVLLGSVIAVKLADELIRAGLLAKI
jgi:hypothetical protein